MAEFPLKSFAVDVVKSVQSLLTDLLFNWHPLVQASITETLDLCQLPRPPL